MATHLDTGTHLDRIVARTRQTLDIRKAAASSATLAARAGDHLPRGFRAALLRAGAHTAITGAGTAIIAELKKASPSKGLLRPDYRPAVVGQAYAAAGAAAISVLTDEPFFQGSLDDLEAVSAAVAVPLLRKDFMVDPWQVLEARAAGADAILLIVAALDDRTLRQLADEARHCGLDVLCEVHDREELNRAAALGFDTIGVNSRNLKTLVVDENLHEQLAPHMPAGVLRVAESGIRTRADVLRLRAAGYGAFLVGEALMRQPDPARELLALLGAPVAES